jgi:hypothetical protein
MSVNNAVDELVEAEENAKRDHSLSSSFAPLVTFVEKKMVEATMKNKV